MKASIFLRDIEKVQRHEMGYWLINLNPLSANLTKQSNTPKNSSAKACVSVFDHFVRLVLIVLVLLSTLSPVLIADVEFQENKEPS